MSSSEQEREYEEGAAGTEIEREDDSLKEYREKEAMTPAKEKDHEPTAVKREMTEKIGTTKSDPEKAMETARRSGTTKGTVWVAKIETLNQYNELQSQTRR